MSIIEVRVPDLGDAKGVNVVDVLVKKGSEVRIDDPLITLESEKASMDVPSPVSGVVDSIEIKKGDEVSAGALIATVQVIEASATSATAVASTQAPGSAAAARRRRRLHRLGTCTGTGTGGTSAPALRRRPRHERTPHQLRLRLPLRQTAAGPGRLREPSIWSCSGPGWEATRRHSGPPT